MFRRHQELRLHVLHAWQGAKALEPCEGVGRAGSQRSYPDRLGGVGQDLVQREAGICQGFGVGLGFVVLTEAHEDAAGGDGKAPCLVAVDRTDTAGVEVPGGVKRDDREIVPLEPLDSRAGNVALDREQARVEPVGHGGAVANCEHPWRGSNCREGVHAAIVASPSELMKLA